MQFTQAPIENPTLATAIECACIAIVRRLHTATPGVIESYDPVTRKASVKPILIEKYKDGSELALPVINNVPVVWPGNARGSVSFPLNRGDGVLLVFSERSLDEWLSLGKDVAPDDRRGYSLNDAIAIPGLFSFAEKDQSHIANNVDAQLTYKDKSVFIRGNGDIEIDGGNKVIIRNNGDIEIGGNGLKKLVTESLISAFNSHTHSGTTLTVPLPTPQTPTIVIGVTGVPVSPLTDSILTAKVKAQ